MVDRTAYKLSSEISTSDPYMTLNSTIHNLGTFNAGSIMTAMYNVSESSSASIGHVANFCRYYC